MPTKDVKVWKAEADKFWPQSNYKFRVSVECLTRATDKQKTQIEVEVDDNLVIIRDEEKKKAFVGWMREIGKVTLEAAAWLEGLRVED